MKDVDVKKRISELLRGNNNSDYELHYQTGNGLVNWITIRRQ